MSKRYFFQQRWFWGTAGLLAGLLLGFVLSEVAYRQADNAFKGASPSTVKSEPSKSLTSKGLVMREQEDRQTWGLDREEIEWAKTQSQTFLDTDFAPSSPRGNDLSHARTQIVRQVLHPYVRPVGYPSGGFEIDSVPSGSILDKRGFKLGDIIRSVNGEPVRSRADLLMHFQALRTGDESTLRIVLDRAGELMIVEYRE